MFDKLKLDGIPNRPILDRNTNERYLLSNEQEQFVVDRLRIIYPAVEWHTTTEFMGIMNPEQNRILGDFIGTRKNKNNVKPDIFVDLKVCAYGMDPSYLGSITLDSVLGFCYKQVNHYYLLVNSNGSDWIVVFCGDIYNLLMNKTTKCLMESKYRTGTKSTYDKFIDKYLHKKKLEGVSGKDYIPGSILRRYDKRIREKQ